MNRNIEQQVEETLNSFEGMQRAEANPFLHTRIMQRWQSKNQAGVQPRWMFSMAAVLLLFISLNIFSLLRVPANEQTTKTDIETFASEYNLDADNSGF